MKNNIRKKIEEFEHIYHPSHNKLKAEAIKWVKEYGWRNPRIDILVVFFNITEEDLK